MNLRLHRREKNQHAVHGQLYLGGLLCVTLEDPKLYIAAGVYPVELRYSPKFQMLLPEIQNVPGRTHILFHAGNRDEDTEGCVLTGVYRVDDRRVGESRVALGKLLTRWREWEGEDIEVVDP